MDYLYFQTIDGQIKLSNHGEKNQFLNNNSAAESRNIKTSGVRIKSNILVKKAPETILTSTKKEDIHTIREFLKNKFIARESWSYKNVDNSIIFQQMTTSLSTNSNAKVFLQLNEDLTFTVRTLF